MNKILVDVLGPFLGSIAGTFAVNYIIQNFNIGKTFILNTENKILSQINTPQKKIALIGALQILKESLPQAAAGMTNQTLVSLLVAKYPVLAPLEPDMLLLLSSVESAAAKDLGGK